MCLRVLRDALVSPACGGRALLQAKGLWLEQARRGPVVHFADLVWLREALLAARRGPVVHRATSKTILLGWKTIKDICNYF